MNYYIQTCIYHDDTVGYQVVLIGDDGIIELSSPTYSEYAEARLVLEQWEKKKSIESETGSSSMYPGLI